MWLLVNMGSKKCECMLKTVGNAFRIFYIWPVVIVTAILGVTLFLVLVSILAMISRINLLTRQLDSILGIFKESDTQMETAARAVMGESPDSGQR